MGVQISAWKEATLMGKGMPRHTDKGDNSAVSCAKPTKPIKIPFGLWTGVGPGKHVLHGGTLTPPGEYD